jgi:hypothetical protein
MRTAPESEFKGGVSEALWVRRRHIDRSKSCERKQDEATRIMIVALRRLLDRNFRQAKAKLGRASSVWQIMG